MRAPSPWGGLTDETLAGPRVWTYTTAVNPDKPTSHHRKSTPQRESIDGMDTGACQGTPVAPLARWILPVHQNEASCHLAGHGEAQRSCELGGSACGPLFIFEKWPADSDVGADLRRHGHAQAAALPSRSRWTALACSRAPPDLTRPSRAACR